MVSQISKYPVNGESGVLKRERVIYCRCMCGCNLHAFDSKLILSSFSEIPRSLVRLRALYFGGVMSTDHATSSDEKVGHYHKRGTQPYHG